jgi:hypothetical protein
VRRYKRFYAAERNVVKFLEDNKTWCGIPDQVIKTAKENQGHAEALRSGGHHMPRLVVGEVAEELAAVVLGHFCPRQRAAQS